MTSLLSRFVSGSRSAGRIGCLLLLVAAPARAANFTVLPVQLGFGNFNSMVIDAANTKHIATYDLGAHHLIYGTQPDLAGWSFEVVDAVGDVGQYCSLALDGLGNPHISYYDATTGALKYAHKSGGFWVTEFADNVSGNVGLNTSIALDSAGNPHILYNDASQLNVRYASRSGGGVWTQENIDLGQADQLRMDRFDRPHMVFHNSNGLGTFIRYGVRTFATTTFDTIEHIPPGSGFSGAISLDLDVSGNPHVSYAAGCNLHYARKLGGTWTVFPVDAVSGVVKATSLRLDQDGSPRIAYQVDPGASCSSVPGSPGNLMFAYKPAEFDYWVRQLVASGTPTSGVSPSLALSATNNPVILFSRSPENDLLVANGALVNGLFASPNAVRPGGQVVITLFGSGFDAGPTQVAQLQQGSTVLSYIQSGVALGAPSISLTFDLTGAPTGPYDLIFGNSAGGDTIPDAVLIYDEAVDLTRLTTNPSPEITPAISGPQGGNRLVFASGRETGQDLFVRNLGPSLYQDLSAYRLTDSHTAEFPSWRSDDARIVYHDGAVDRLFVMDAHSGTILGLPVQLTTGGPARNPSWNPLSDVIAYDDGTGIFMISYPGNVVTPLVANGIDPDWGPDGQTLVYTVDEGLSGKSIRERQVLPTLGPETVLVPAGGYQNFGPQWSPDGKWVAFSTNQPSGSDFNVWVTDSRGRGWRFPITTNAATNEAQVAWGKDGQSLSFISTASGNQDVVEASNLPMFQDADHDGVPDQVDTCPAESLLLGQIDQNQDGCPDLASSFRFTRYWAPDRFPLTIERNLTGDPAITDGSEFTAYTQAFAAWAAQGPMISGNLVANGSQDAVTGDGRNTLTFTDPDGFILGTVAITFSTVADEDTTIGGRVYHRGEIVDSDILFNTLHYTFSTPTSPGPAGSFDLQSVATHELGHFFGFGHSTIQKSTMFYVAYRGTGQETLERDDIVLAQNGYHLPEGAIPTLSVEGKVLRGEDGVTPVPGAAVFAITATNDTIQMTVSGVDGTYRFFDLPEPTRIFIAPLDGSEVVNGLTPSGISADLASVARTDFLSEYYDGLAESNADFGTSGFLIPDYPQTGANILTNPDLTGPQVVSVSPADGTANVPASTSIVIGFDERIDINTISGNLRLRDLTSGQGVGGQAAFLTPSNLLVFTPTGPLAFNIPYELTVGPGITDQVGNPMGTTVVTQFTTQLQPPVAVTGASPAEVPIGGTLVLSGTGFAPTPGGVNEVNFTGGTVATAYAATLDQLFVTVPPGTQSGNINVAVNGVSSNDFSIVIVPPQAPPVGVLLGNSPLGGDPRKVAITPSGAFAYVATSVGVTAVDASPQSATFLQATPIAIAGGSKGVAAHPDGQRVFAVSSNPPALDVIDGVPTSSFFNTVVQTIPLNEEPLGIAIEPGGAHALIAFSDRVASFGLTSGPTFGLEVRNWTQTGVTFLGDVSVSADGAEAYAASAGGKVAVLGQALGEGIVGFLAAGTTPRESAGTPAADAFFTVDESGMIHRFAARGPAEGSLTVSGSYSGLALSPDGSFAFALNFTSNRVDVVDAQSLTPVLLSSFATGVDPEDLAVGGGGRYFYVAVDQTNVLEVYDGQSGVLVKSIFPRSGGDQTLITVAGTGFNPVAQNNSVHIGAAVAPVVGVNAAGTALTVLQSGVVSGPLRVTTGGQNSNPVQYKGVNLDQTPFVGMGALNDAIIPEIANLLETPDGRWLLGLRSDGSMTVLGADPAQPNFLRPVQDLTNTDTQLSGVGPMVITPDGKKIYVGEFEGSRVTVFALSGSSTAPLTRVGAITDPTMTLASFVLAMTPDGSRLLILSNVDKVVYEVATGNDSVLNTGAADAMGPLSNPSGMAVDPRGNRLYVSDSINGTTGLVVFDLDPASATYRQSVGTVNLGAGFAGQIFASPRGDFLYCETLYTLALNAQFNVSVVDTRPQSATYLQSLGTHPVGLDVGPVLAPNHSGNVVYLLGPNAPGSLVAYSADGNFTPIAIGPSSARLSGRSAIVASLDDARLYVPALGGGIYVTDVSGVNSYHITSGDGQVGVANQPLPAPLVVDAEKVGGEPAEGTVVVYTGLNGNFGPSIPNAITATNGQGFAQASYVNGPVAGPDRVDATSAAGTLEFFLNVVGDTSAAPPQLLTVTPGPNDQPGNLTNVAADFSKAIVPGTVSSATFTLRVPGGAPLSGIYSFANQGRRVVFDPTAPLAFNATYEVDVAAGLQDYNGNPLTNPGTFTFTTGAPPLLSLAAVNAPAALPGNVIVLSGSGFNSTPAQNTVLFSGGAAAIPTQGDPASLSVLVPTNAVSGSVRVVVGPDSSNTVPFTVLGRTTPLNQTFDVVQVPSSGQSIAVLPNGTRAYMTSPGANTVVPVLIATGAAENAIAVGQYPFGVAAAPNSQKVYVSNFQSNTVSVIGTDPLLPGFHQVINTIPTGINPSGLVVNPDGRTLYVCNYGSSTVSFIDVDPTSATYNTAKAEVTIGSTSKAVGVSPDGTTLIVGTSNSVLLLSTADGSAKADVTVGSSSKGVGVSPDGAFAVVLLDDGNLVLIDIRPGVPDDERAKAEVTVGTTSQGVGISPDGGSVYVTQSDGTVDVYAIVSLGGGAAVAQPVTSLYSFKFITSIQVGENPIGLAIDPVSGLLLVVNSGDNTISFINITDVPMGASGVTVNVDPNTIKPTAQGNYISAAIQFPTFLNPMDVVLSSVRLNATVPAETTLSALTDQNGDGIMERQVKFNRQAVVAILPNADSVTVTVSGLIGTLPFSASDKVRLLRPKIHQPHAAQVVAQLGQAKITWASSPDGPADHMDILWSRDNGANWEPIVTGTPDDTSYVWNVPDVPSSRSCLIMLVAKDRRNGVLGVDVSADPFTVSDAPVGIEEVIPARFALLPAAPNPFTALGTKVRFDLPEAARVTLRIYSVDGGVVRTLADNAPYPAGRHAVIWDGRSELGQPVHGGVYFLKIQAGTHDGVQKIVRVTR
jgi:YVTN family beta-propeller protein